MGSPCMADAVPAFLTGFFFWSLAAHGPLVHSDAAECLVSHFSLSCCGQACVHVRARGREQWYLKFSNLHIATCKATPLNRLFLSFCLDSQSFDLILKYLIISLANDTEIGQMV